MISYHPASQGEKKGARKAAVRGLLSEAVRCRLQRVRRCRDGSLERPPVTGSATGRDVAMLACGAGAGAGRWPVAWKSRLILTGKSQLSRSRREVDITNLQEIKHYVPQNLRRRFESFNSGTLANFAVGSALSFPRPLFRTGIARLLPSKEMTHSRRTENLEYRMFKSIQVFQVPNIDNVACLAIIRIVMGEIVSILQDLHNHAFYRWRRVKSCPRWNTSILT